MTARGATVAFGFPNISFIGYPVALPCMAHGGLGIREAGRSDRQAMVEHFMHLDAEDRRMRFCAALADVAVAQHVERSVARRRTVILSAHDGPLWSGPMMHAGPIRALAEFAIDGDEAELGLSVDKELRRRGIGTYLIETAASLLAPRGVRRIVAYTLPGNVSFLSLARALGARITSDRDNATVTFDVPALGRANFRHRLSDQVFPRAG